MLNKIPSFTDKTLRTVIFNVNQHVATDGSGSPAERFFKRRIRTGLPTIIKKEIKYEDLMNIRARKQIGAAKKKGRTSADVFEIDDEARVQDINTKRWNKVGKSQRSVKQMMNRMYLM